MLKGICGVGRGDGCPLQFPSLPSPPHMSREIPFPLARRLCLLQQRVSGWDFLRTDFPNSALAWGINNLSSDQPLRFAPRRRADRQATDTPIGIKPQPYPTSFPMASGDRRLLLPNLSTPAPIAILPHFVRRRAALPQRRLEQIAHRLPRALLGLGVVGAAMRHVAAGL